MRGNILHVLKCRLVMYIERDSRKTTAGKEQQSGNEYLSKCLDLLIHHIVQELPGILGKLSQLTEQILSSLAFFLTYFWEILLYLLTYTDGKSVFSDYLKFACCQVHEVSWFCHDQIFCIGAWTVRFNSVRKGAQLDKKFYWCSKGIPLIGNLKADLLYVVQSKERGNSIPTSMF